MSCTRSDELDNLHDELKRLQEENEELKRTSDHAHFEELIALEMMCQAVGDVENERFFNELVATDSTKELVALRNEVEQLVVANDRLEDRWSELKRDMIKTGNKFVLNIMKSLEEF